MKSSINFQIYTKVTLQNFYKVIMSLVRPWFVISFSTIYQTFACSELPIENLERGVKYV